MAEQVQETSPQVVNKRLIETDVQDWSLWHHLIFCQELENDDQKHDFCWLCKEPVSGSAAYKCLKCNFRRHKSCIDRSHGIDLEIQHHYWWNRHHLMLEVIDITINVVCSGCKEPVFGPAYKCSLPECAFLLHKSCGEQSNAIQHPIHPDHTLFLREPSLVDDCSVCHKNCSGSFCYRCRLCSFNLDVVCASRWRTNADDCLKHELIPLRKGIQLTCESCGEEAKDDGCICSQCRVLIHDKCNQFPPTINTRTHDHSLVRTYSLICQVEKQDNVFCGLCYKEVKTKHAAYFCRECGYVAHLKCAKDQQSYNGQTSNSVEYLPHLVHLVEGIGLAEGQEVGPREIKHFSHPQHHLILSNEELMDNTRCEGCMHMIIDAPFYGCVQCNFFLHNRCAKLPLRIKRGPFHVHSLTLLSRAPFMDESFWCETCKRDRHGFTYMCDECWYTLDVQCCLIPETLEHEGHQHSLFLAVRYYETCNACGEKSIDKNVIFVCTACNFKLCIRCATLPLVGKYQYHTHLLNLSYTREDNTKEYYCMICEEERDHPDYWFYYCVKCKFTAHTRCIIGGNPCIKFGRTYVDKAHRHPLRFVEKSQHSPPCDLCGKFMNNVALECTQCKFNMHPRFDMRGCMVFDDDFSDL
ncbi:uncharacterized protein LOC133881334 [Alnus glutinosa]|uniref:uncharacterized protein LOC133881334 n=1 Tax=Alnus glutinosa TaxID=3517 RepID=UPI002D79CA47|nr:uncharacterized protein LOC133881334 [Alnus glutinosa]